MGGDLKDALKQDKDVTVFQRGPLWVMTLIEVSRICVLCVVRVPSVLTCVLCTQWWVMKCNPMCNYHELHDDPERSVAGIRKLFAATVAGDERLLSPASVALCDYMIWQLTNEEAMMTYKDMA
jgi:hypothetical protein